MAKDMAHNSTLIQLLSV